MRYRTELVLGVIQAFKAYWFAGSGQIDERNALRELGEAIDKMVEDGGESELKHADKTGA